MLVFSAMWSENLEITIKAAASKPFNASFTGEDAISVVTAVNQGIDSHLEACFIPARGDSYERGERKLASGRVITHTLECKVSPESLPVLIRRLLESEDENGMSVASFICYTLGIELV